ncbi:MAG TPA: glycosyltransferase 87 family protein [Actinomycetota bacterium]|nr:glycosyltransferase 87 family protein [Actinomycetota bacterium]
MVFLGMSLEGGGSERAGPVVGSGAAMDTVATRRPAWALAATAWVLAAGVAVFDTAHYLHPPTSARLGDLHVYLVAVHALLHGHSLYGAHPGLRSGFTYPPFAALLLIPLALVPEAAAQVTWTLLTLAATGALSYLVARALPRRLGPAAAVWPALTALLLASKPLQSNLAFGQVSVFLALGVVADLLARRGRRYQGALTGLCAALKLTPLVFVPYLWLTGRRRAAGVALGTFGAATALAGLGAPGNSRSFWGGEVFHVTRGLPLAEGGNQSIYGVLLRAGAHGAALGALWAVLSGGALVLGLWRARRACEAGQPVLGLAITGCAGILASPISWTHHELWVLLGAAGVFTASTGADIAVAAVILVPMVIGLPGAHLLGPPGRWLAANDRSVLAALVACVLPFRDLTGSRPGPTGPGGARRGAQPAAQWRDVSTVEISRHHRQPWGPSPSGSPE